MTAPYPDDDDAVEFAVTCTDQELQEILDLQTANRSENLTREELESQGFVTARHDLQVLRKMHQEYPHVIAKTKKTKKKNDDDTNLQQQQHVIGYALCMMKSAEVLVPTLSGLFQNIENSTTRYQGKVLVNQSIHGKDDDDNQHHGDNHNHNYCYYYKYFVMGQVCVHKDYRGKGIFQGLYQHMKQVMAPHFHGVVTSISTRNQRSLRAHAKVGFSIFHEYSTKEEDWKLVVWDWTTTREQSISSRTPLADSLEYTTTKNESDLEQILNLQQMYHKENLTPEQQQNDGYLSIGSERQQ
eukprot:scaffold795_cov187-Amphora_coffeaeformis.AAC.8